MREEARQEAGRTSGRQARPPFLLPPCCALVACVPRAILLPPTAPLPAQPPPAPPPQPRAKTPPPPGKRSDVEFVERLLATRREYQQALEGLRAHYIAAGDLERAKWAEDELIQFHRIS